MTTQCLQNQDGKKSAASVYLLTFPNGKCYVGVSVRPGKRFMEHLKFAGGGAEYALHNAIRKHGEPAMTILASNLTQQEAFLMEVLLIKERNTKAPNGYNMTNGGEGVVGIAPETLKAMGKARSKRIKEDAAFREQMRVATLRTGPHRAIKLKEFWASPEGMEVLRARSNSAWKDNVIAHNKRQRTPETLEKFRVAKKSNWEIPAQREKMNAAREAKQAELRATNPEWVAARAAKMAATMKAKWEDPAYLAKMAMRKPPVLSAESRARAVKNRLATMMTPEKRAETSEKLRQSWAKRKELKLAQSQG